MAELVTSDVIDRTESLNLLFDEKNRTKMAFGPVLYSKQGKNISKCLPMCLFQL